MKLNVIKSLFDNSEETSESWSGLGSPIQARDVIQIELQNKSDY